MKKAAFFTTIVLFMGVIGYLSQNQAKAIIDDSVTPILGPFTLVVSAEAAEILFVRGETKQPPAHPCNLEVTFFDASGKTVGEPIAIQLTTNHIMSATLDPSPVEAFTTGQREHFVGHVRFENPAMCIRVFATAGAYDKATGFYNQKFPIWNALWARITGSSG
jgi:hypothetical protein